jgi:hypothetical protein
VATGNAGESVPLPAQGLSQAAADGSENVSTPALSPCVGEL